MNPLKLIGMSLVAVTWCMICPPAAGQVWIDVSQLDKWPDWVDPAYRHPDKPVSPPVIVPPPPERWEWVRVWIPPVTRQITEQVWVEGRYVWRQVVIWEDGRQIVRYERIWCPEHDETRTREIVLTPGRWEWVRRPLRPYPPSDPPIYRPMPEPWR